VSEDLQSRFCFERQKLGLPLGIWAGTSFLLGLDVVPQINFESTTTLMPTKSVKKCCTFSRQEWRKPLKDGRSAEIMNYGTLLEREVMGTLR
jgi:hypothetical protein